MAYNDSGELPVSQSTYSLGGYTFELKVQTVHEPGEEDVVSVFAICHDPDGSRETQAADFPSNTTVKNWCVEANEDEATVYATTEQPGGMVLLDGEPTHYFCPLYNTYYEIYETELIGTLPLGGSITFEGTTVEARRSRYWCYLYVNGSSTGVRWGESNFPAVLTRKVDKDTRYGTYGFARVVLRTNDYTGLSAQTYSMYTFRDCVITREPIVAESLIGRFAIDIREADGGPDGDWDEPGDDGPPGTTLNVTVTGATAGSCTGTPADNEIVKGYGDGGDGGYGGGGGAGASTVIIYEFATSIADSVQQEAISRGPGTGGPGGKGGKGGDGCILIFY